MFSCGAILYKLMEYDIFNRICSHVQFRFLYFYKVVSIILLEIRHTLRIYRRLFGRIQKMDPTELTLIGQLVLWPVGLKVG